MDVNVTLHSAKQSEMIRCLYAILCLRPFFIRSHSVSAAAAAAAAAVVAAVAVANIMLMMMYNFLAASK